MRCRRACVVHVDGHSCGGSQIADALTKNAVRVIDLFREWDDDDSGTVTRKEFHKAMGQFGLDVPPEEVDKLFDEWDPDKSGVLEIKELQPLFKRRVELDPSLMPGGAGEIELGIDQKYAVRKEKVNKEDATKLQGFDIDESEGAKPIHEQAWRERGGSVAVAAMG